MKRVLTLLCFCTTVFLSACNPITELTDTESKATQIKLAETMIAETAAFETKLQVAIQNTLEAQPTRTPTSTTESKTIAVTVKIASNTQIHTATLTSTPEPTATLDIIPKGKEKHRADLILLCKARQNFAQSAV